MLDQGGAIIRRFPDTVIVVDHLGLSQPLRRPMSGVELPKLLALAQYSKVRVKVSGASTMSHQPFAYDDIWGNVLRVIDAFGLDGCMWGTVWMRTI
jgi:L-fuconolactonase